MIRRVFEDGLLNYLRLAAAGRADGPVQASETGYGRLTLTDGSSRYVVAVSAAPDGLVVRDSGGLTTIAPAAYARFLLREMPAGTSDPAVLTQASFVGSLERPGEEEKKCRTR